MVSRSIILLPPDDQQLCDQNCLLLKPIFLPVNVRTFPPPDDCWICPLEIQWPTITSLPPPLISPLTHPRHLSSQSNGQSGSSILLVHSPCNPRPLNIPCTRRTKTIVSPVPSTFVPQQPHSIDSMAEKEKDRAQADNCI